MEDSKRYVARRLCCACKIAVWLFDLITFLMFPLAPVDVAIVVALLELANRLI